MDVYSLRMNKIQELLSRKRLDSLLVTNLFNVQYLTGFTGSSCDLLLSHNQTYFITDSRYWEQAEKELNKGVKIIKEKKGLLKALKSILSKEKIIKRLAVEADHLTYNQYHKLSNALEKIELVPSSDIVSKLRQIKDENEINLIKQACQIAQEAFQELLPQIKPGVKERDLAIELEYLIKKNGAESAFEIIVASGSRSSLPHGRATNKEIETGDLVLIDWGARYKGYNCDLTRTIIVGQQPTEKQELIYRTVKDAQQEAILYLKPGIKTSEVDKKARHIMAKQGLDKYFGHSLGHGVGREVHEAPAISSRLKGVSLKSSMVVTVEPGIYLPGFGGVRIEDTVVIRPEGAAILTS